MQSKYVISLSAILAAATLCPVPAKADGCTSFTSQGPTCFFETGVVNVYLGTLTLLAPDGSFLSTTNMVTASSTNPTTAISTTTTLPAPDALIADYPDLVTQLENDIQSMDAGLPSFLYPALTNLEDANGFGESYDGATSPDPAVSDFNADLANVGGPYSTISDTGFQYPAFSQAYCDYENSLTPGFPLCSGPPPPGGDSYEFTYVLGPEVIGGNTFISLVNFQIFERDVTEELTEAPEPSLTWLVGGALAGLIVFARRRRGSQWRSLA